MAHWTGHRHSGRTSTREQRRWLRREDQQRRRARAWRHKGQTLIIFALSITVLLGLAGLVVDVARAYDLYARMQRAAEAGALAGVLYMPLYYNAARTPGDGLSAVARATTEIYKDGFGTGVSAIPAGNPCPTPVTSAEIAICQITTAQSDLEVTITEHLDVTLLGELGVTPITLSVHAQAEYLPPVQIGSRENYFGDQVECSPDGTTTTTTSACSLYDGGKNHLQYFLATMNGPADLKESGDPYVYCEEGPSYLTQAYPNQPTPGEDPTTAPNTYNGKVTNHPQQTGVTNGLTGIHNYCGKPNPGVTQGNPDYQPAGYDGPATAGTAHEGGYNYAINVSSAISGASLWIFNPYYMPQDSSGSVDHFQDSGTGAPNYYQDPYTEQGIGNNFDGSHHDAPLFFFNTTFTLYKVTNLYDRTSDVQVWSQTYQPLDDTSADLTAHHCPAGTIYDPYWEGAQTPNTYYQASQIPNPGGSGALGGCDTPPACEQPQFDAFANTMALNWSLWCQAPYTLTQGVYRLVVEVTGLPAHTSAYTSTLQDGYGQHAYALKLCNGAPVTPINCDNGAGGTGQFTNTNLTIYGWNNVDITAQQTLGNAAPNPNNPQNSCVSNANDKYACIDLGCIPSTYAGRTVTAQLFDPGDGGGNLYLGVVPPSAGINDVTISPPSYVTSLSGPTYDGDKVVQAHNNGGYTPFNGLWLNFTIKLASTYSGSCPSSGVSGGTYPGWFQLVYMSDNGGNPGDKLAIQFTLVGSPVHLVPPSLG
jgi:hypothetical protein